MKGQEEPSAPRENPWNPPPALASKLSPSDLDVVRAVRKEVLSCGESENSLKRILAEYLETMRGFVSIKLQKSSGFNAVIATLQIKESQSKEDLVTVENSIRRLRHLYRVRMNASGGRCRELLNYVRMKMEQFALYKARTLINLQETALEIDSFLTLRDMELNQLDAIVKKMKSNSSGLALRIAKRVEENEALTRTYENLLMSLLE